MRKEAAKEIEAALKKSGTYKLIFVITLEGGRLRPDDLLTMKVILESIDDKSFPYAVVVNKATQRLIRELNTDPAKLKEFLVTLNYNLRGTSRIFLNALENELVDEDDKLIKANPEFKLFLENLPTKQVLPDRVKPIKTEDFDELKESFERQIQALRTDNLKREKEFERQKEAWRKERQEEAQKKEKEQNENTLFGGVLGGALTSILSIVITRLLGF